MLLLAADFFKSATYVAFGVVMFFQKNVTTSSAVCQATGAINEYFVEITGEYPDRHQTQEHG